MINWTNRLFQNEYETLKWTVWSIKTRHPVNFQAACSNNDQLGDHKVRIKYEFILTIYNINFKWMKNYIILFIAILAILFIHWLCYRLVWTLNINLSLFCFLSTISYWTIGKYYLDVNSYLEKGLWTELIFTIYAHI